MDIAIGLFLIALMIAIFISLSNLVAIEIEKLRDTAQIEEMQAYPHISQNGHTYRLYKSVTKLQSGKERVLYFFSQDERENPVAEVPVGLQVKELDNGLPVLRKVTVSDGN